MFCVHTWRGRQNKNFRNSQECTHHVSAYFCRFAGSNTTKKYYDGFPHPLRLALPRVGFWKASTSAPRTTPVPHQTVHRAPAQKVQLHGSTPQSM